MFFLLGISDTFLSQVDKFLIGYRLGFYDVGNYSIISIIPLTTFNIIASSLGLIVMPYLINKRNNIYSTIKYMVMIIFILPVIIFSFFHFSGVYLVNFFFDTNLKDIDNLFY